MKITDLVKTPAGRRNTRQVLPAPDLLRSETGVSGFYFPYARNTPPNTRESLSHEFYSPVKLAFNLHLARCKTPPSVLPRLLHAVASEVWHEKDVITRKKIKEVTGSR